MTLTCVRLGADSSVCFDFDPKFSDDSIEWTLRHNPGLVTPSLGLQAATIMGQFAHLIDPHVTYPDAKAQLHKIRKAYEQLLKGDLNDVKER